MMYKTLQYSFSDVDLINMDIDGDFVTGYVKEINSEINDLRKLSDDVHFFGVDIKGDVLEIRNELVILGDEEKPMLEVTAYLAGGQVELKKYFTPDCSIEVELTATNDLFIQQVVEEKEKEPDIDKIDLKTAELRAKAKLNL